MKIAIISDIHGNMEAFEQVSADIARSRVDDIISLGDHIGYGPQPEEVINRIRRHNITALQGNHELALVEPTYLDWFNQAARKSLNITRTLLSPQSLHFIANLKTHRSAHGCRFVHGFPPDSVLTYLFQLSDETKIQALERLSEKRCFIGHTHTLDIVSLGRQGLQSNKLKEGLNKLDSRRKYIISAGSVGQPRDGNNKAKYLIWDSTDDTVDVKFVAYDIAAVVEKMMAVGMPQKHAQRLW
ncbi:MAG: metallophosphoesterase family protein [Desulfobacterales bacterium]|jgi:diadenosine tetraphosphatase ApaH/serine/threonine PP2A family protein phosphatase